MIDLSGYELEALHRDGELILYRGAHPRPADGAPSSVLVVGPAGEYASPGTLARLEHEYSLAGELDPRWAVRPIALVRHRGHRMLVLDDPGGQPLDRQLGTPMEIGPFLRLAIGLVGAVASLHRAGLIHKDIKPTSVIAASTGEVRLTSFGIASRMRRERVAAAPPEVIAGTLAYMAPEQTGWMNRSVDSRSDLYALGVTLYEMVSGTLPFTASDPMEWVHCHVARRPAAPVERVKEIPTSIAAIIMRLLAKTAEERYQTAAGLERDLRRCLVQWEAERRIDAFPLGTHDTPDRLMMPEKLYGRARETDTLLAAFDRVVTSGMPELVLVSGAAGIGKSAIVNELHTVLVPARGFFAAGKFDQYKRDIPYATLAQAFQSLIQHLLGKSETELDSWRAALREALVPNGRLMVDLVPELTLLIGDQPPVPELAPQDAQRRFQLVFRRFLGVFARPDHPLALFLDDLQWLDAATLDMLEDLFTQGDVRSLLVIGAYRDNEVSGIHPLRRTLETIRHAGASVQEISLAPLARHDVGQLIADALHCEPVRVTPLAQLVHDKTAGNPFFVTQFIAALAEEELLAFDHGQRWSWDLDRIHAKGYAENVVDLMVGKLHRLPIDTQGALQQLACLGHGAAITTLALVYGTSEEEVHARLWEAVRNEVIERVEGTYTFIHDRVQEAAYSLIPEDGRARAHLRIGRVLAAQTPPEKRDEAIFEIVNQLNRGAALITEQAERDRLAELNLIAGTRAKNSTAYNSALTYLLAGAAFLAGDCWERQHALTFSLELHRAECEFVTGALAAAEERLTALSMRAATAVEHATVACLRMDVYTTLGQSGRAIAVGLDYLRRVGIDWSPHPTEEDVRREYERIWAQLGGRTVEELIELPLMSDVALLAILDVLTQLAPPAWHTDANLLSLVVCRAVNLSLEGGNGDGSCYAYVLLGAIAGPRFGDYQAGFRFGQLGYDLVEQRGLKRFQAEVYLTLNLVLPWTRHVRIGRDLVRRAFEAANMIGDLTCASYCSNQLSANLLAAGDPLAETQRVAEDGLAFAQKMRFGHSIDVVSTQLGLIRTLRGLTRKFGSLDDERFDERRIERRFADNPDLVVAESRYWICKLQARYLAGDFAAAAEAASRAERLLWISQTPLDAAECRLYCALSHAAVCGSATAGERQHHVEALTAHHRQLAVWAENGPENFEHRAALVGAEIARLEGRELDAMRLYERAIQSARANGFVHHEALAHELAGRFSLQGGFETAGSAHLRHARACYALWGADAKARQLDELYPHLTQAAPPPDAWRTIGGPIEHLELATVLNVLRAVSGELVLDTLIETLLRTALEHAGAERGLFIVQRGGDLSIQAEATISGNTVRVRLCETPVSGAALAASVVRYAARTRENVILDDASARNPFSDDEYIGHRRARSVLCLPLVKQGTLVAVLYLENNLAPGVFTPGRMAVLQLLASEAAMSLDNGRLYRELQEREARIRRLVDANIIGVVITELDGPIVEANDAFLAMLGYSRDDLVAGRLEKAGLIPAEWHATVQRTVAQIRATGRYETHEIEFIRRDGSRVAALVGGAAFEDTRTKAVSFVLDLTERKRSEEALRQAHTELAHVTRVTTLGELAASIAHEVNQPLAAIVADANACLNWLAGTDPRLDEAREALAAIVNEGDRAAEVVQRIRQLAKKTPPRKTSIDLNHIIQDVVGLLRAELQRHHVTLTLDLASELPLVLGDRIQLQQVLLNLTMNAIDAMAAVADRSRELVIRASQSDRDHVMIAVQDTGVGIAANDLDHVFSAFFTTKPGGMGMGLSISRSIIESHGGRLWATPNPTHGATFHFEVPVEGR